MERLRRKKDYHLDQSEILMVQMREVTNSLERCVKIRKNNFFNWLIPRQILSTSVFRTIPRFADPMPLAAHESAPPSHQNKRTAAGGQIGKGDLHLFQISLFQTQSGQPSPLSGTPDPSLSANQVTLPSKKRGEVPHHPST